MALKSDRHIYVTEVNFHLNEVAERGVICSLSTGGSGAAMDQGEALLTVATAQSGKVPAGLLLNDMVNLDQTRQHINYYKDEVQKGGKVCVMKKGWVVTNKILGTPTAGGPAYLGASGLVQVTNEGAAASPLVGRFWSTKDADGYAKVFIDLN